MDHVSHGRPLILKKEQKSDRNLTEEINCNGCFTPLSGPFYSCDQCNYRLHKVCAELPQEMNHPMHPEHPLTFEAFSQVGYFECQVCADIRKGFSYYCSVCRFRVDVICAASSHKIEDKCHSHPLTPLQLPINFPCSICRREEKGVSYKCSTCQFWVHQNCTLLSSSVKHADHEHALTLLDSIPRKYRQLGTSCDICHSSLSRFDCVYSCCACLFFAHAGCAVSETSYSRVKRTNLLPMRPGQTNLIFEIVKDYMPRDGFIRRKLKYFGHCHYLIRSPEELDGKICEACLQPISAPSFGCSKCNYFIHYGCTLLPKKVLHPFHPDHQLSLVSQPSDSSFIFKCTCCLQLCNGLRYQCTECNSFCIDVKCGCLLGLDPIKHEGHNHPLVPIRISSWQSENLFPWLVCSSCNVHYRDYMLKCMTCYFNLCMVCAMLPPTVNHRFGKIPFVLTYSPFENHDRDYICELCELELYPKGWFYHSRDCDQFVHVRCMHVNGAGSNIQFGKHYTVAKHQHELTFVSLSRNYSACGYCGEGLNRESCIGLQCAPCNVTLHLECALD